MNEKPVEINDATEIDYEDDVRECTGDYCEIDWEEE